jgi:cytochrome c-type biogenesis protein CcmH/NrfG
LRKNSSVVSWIAIFVTGFVAGIIFSAWKLDTNIHKTAKPAGHPNHAKDEKARDRQKIAAIKKMLEMDPGNLNAWVQLGNVYFGMEQYQDALRAYDKALEINPNNIDVITDAGVSLRRLGKGKEAARRFKKVLEINPDHELALFNLGIVLRDDLKDRQGAIEAWERFLERRPDSRLVIMVKQWLKDAKAAQDSRDSSVE